MSTYDDNVKLWKKAYTEIAKVCDKYPDFDVYNFRDIRDMQTSAKDHLLLIDWYEKYGLKLSHDHKPYSYNYFKMSEYLSFNYFGNAEKEKNLGSGRFISWSDDDRQPKDEWLLNISFSTGAYIFGDDYEYQQQLFQDFIKELKSYNPDYSDTPNKSFYWKLENVKPIYEEFSGILNKYRERNQSELKTRQAEKMRRELAELEAEL